ncbi:MAG: Na/Pi symporter, partial [bacterium]
MRFWSSSVSTLALAGAATLAAVTAHAAGVAELTLDVSRPSPHSQVFVGTVGDTLAGEIVLSVSDAEGAPVPGVALSVRPVGGGAAVPIGRTHVTDARGDVVVPVELVGPPGDALLLARIPGQEDEIEIRMRVLRRSWLPLLVVGICGGLALFLYGLRLIGRSLEKAASGGMRSFLGSMTGGRLRSLAFGTVSSLVVQSSGASTVLLVSFASSGLVTVRQSLGAVLGAAIGATVTTQLIAFRISDAALALVALGFVLTMFRGNRRRIGGAILGLGLIFYGLQVMSNAMAPLKDFPV